MPMLQNTLWLLLFHPMYSCTKINFHSQASLSTCFTTGSSHMSLFLSCENLSSHPVCHFSSIFLAWLVLYKFRAFCIVWDYLGDVVFDCHNGYKLLSLPACQFTWLEPFHWKPNQLFLKYNSIIEKTMLLLALIDQGAGKVVLSRKKWGCNSVCSMIERAIYEVNLYSVFTYLSSLQSY